MSYKKISLIIFIKYIVYFIILATFNNSKEMILGNGHDEVNVFSNLVVYILYVLVFTLFMTLLFSAPIYVLFKCKNPVIFMIFLLLIVIGEYIFYTWIAAQPNFIIGIYNGILTILVIVGLSLKKYLMRKTSY